MQIRGQIGSCGNREVFVGFAPAGTLAALSFADVLDEASGSGYQRRFSREHSLEFKRYIQSAGATSIPLTFNLRQQLSQHWRVERHPEGLATLVVDETSSPVLAQVDGQHRLGFLQGSPITFAFMTYIGLTVAEEMEVFRTINGKAKGLSGSLLDFTEARLLGEDLPLVNPDLFVALKLHEDARSPWFQRLDLGGDKTVGMKRVASLRMMQFSVKRLIRAAQWPVPHAGAALAEIAIDFWRAVATVLPTEWANPRKHMVVKGIGVYALMSLAGTFVREAGESGIQPSQDLFISKLSDFVDRIDWSNDGPLHGFGGGAGADAALEMLLQTRRSVFNQYRAHA